MHHIVFVYGTLLVGEVNHYLLSEAEPLGPHRTEPCYTMFGLGAYPGVARGGKTPIRGELYKVDAKGLEHLDRLEDYPRLYDRNLIPSSHGRAWVYLYRGRIRGRPVIGSGDWRDLSAVTGSFRAAAVRATRDRKNPRWREKLG